MSAQQARERKKQYVGQLEEEVQRQEDQIRQLRDKLRDVEAQNETLRRIIKAIRPPTSAAVAVSSEAQQPQLQPMGSPKRMRLQGDGQ